MNDYQLIFLVAAVLFLAGFALLCRFELFGKNMSGKKRVLFQILIIFGGLFILGVVKSAAENAQYFGSKDVGVGELMYVIAWNGFIGILKFLTSLVGLGTLICFSIFSRRKERE